MDSPILASPIIDTLIAYCDRRPEPLAQGGVNAAVVTVCGYHARLPDAVKEMAEWHKALDEKYSSWFLVQTTEDIARAQKEKKVGLIMGWQNALPIESNPSLLYIFHKLGLRVLQLTYNEANTFADGCYEERNGGLSNKGGELIYLMNEIGVAIDLSHCAEKTVLEAAAASKKPVLLTHANSKVVNPSIRNKSDEALKAVANTGGVVGVSIHGFMNWNGDPKSPPSISGFLEHVKYIVSIIGVEHVAIGTDLACVTDDTYMNTLLETNRVAYERVVGSYIRAFGNTLAGRYPKEISSPRKFFVLLQALDQAGYSDREIELLAGLNTVRALREIWGK